MSVRRVTGARVGVSGSFGWQRDAVDALSYGFIPVSVYGMRSPRLHMSVAARHAAVSFWHALIAATHGTVATFIASYSSFDTAAS